MPAARKIPMRKCTGCNEMKPKKELVRVVRSPEGEISLDLTGKKPGRGAYVCRDEECLKKARKATDPVLILLGSGNCGWCV